ncbi:MAG TPA: S8 family serine peptidase [Vicinamibacterales bacterium]|jgi:subtilisin|nr:S8 family serine peptidase [Vicinamibacterales bacterium]
MARYVMANRRAGKFNEAEKKASRAALDAGFNELFATSVSVVADRNPQDELARRVVVFDGDPEEVAAKAATLPADVMLEPEILHFPLVQTLERHPGARVVGLRSSTVLDLPSAAPLAAFTATITGSGAPLFGAEVILFLTDPFNSQRNMTQISDRNGTVSFAVPAEHQAVAMLILPAGGHWSMVVRNPVNGMLHDCPPFSTVGPLDWWHRQLGVSFFDPNLGAAIKVGVIDTGVGPNGCLTHVNDVGAFINGDHDPDGGADVDSHGSHVCGTIGARPVQVATHRAGIAPGATLFSARVFPPNEGASQGDIANAIDELSRERGVDLINMSLGAASASAIELDAIQDALQRGTLCVCAAGNDRGGVSFPAAFPEAVAVSAVGKRDTAPAGSLSATRLPTDPTKLGSDDLFLAEFSNFGNQVDCGSPGVGIISTVPERFDLVEPYAVMDGTSMASPAACGALAVLLATAPDYQALTGSARAEKARSILRDNCQSIGLAIVFQGRGVPRVP